MSAGKAVRIAVASFKGGVGKTTLAACLSLGLSLIDGKRVLMIDLDPQANLTEAFITQKQALDMVLVEKGIVSSYDSLAESKDPTVIPVAGI
ncbi:MAG: ParA family protein, partial [Desulfurococcaceae archaeon]